MNDWTPAREPEPYKPGEPFDWETSFCECSNARIITSGTHKFVKCGKCFKVLGILDGMMPLHVAKKIKMKLPNRFQDYKLDDIPIDYLQNMYFQGGLPYVLELAISTIMGEGENGTTERSETGVDE